MQNYTHAHSRHVHSVVLNAGTPTVRLYFADRNHTLWKNYLTFRAGECKFNESMSVAVHSHRQTISLLPIFGNVYNFSFSQHAPTFGAVPCHLQAFRYRSAILTGKGGFEPAGHETIYYKRECRLSSLLRLGAKDLHTIYVSKGERAAWFVIEGSADPEYDSTCYSNADLTAVDFSELYKPMSEGTQTRILRRCFNNEAQILARLKGR